MLRGVVMAAAVAACAMLPAKTPCQRLVPVEWWAKDVEGRTVVIVVNTSEKSQKVEIDVGS